MNNFVQSSFFRRTFIRQHRGAAGLRAEVRRIRGDEALEGSAVLAEARNPAIGSERAPRSISTLRSLGIK